MKGPTLRELVTYERASKPTVVRVRNGWGHGEGWITACDVGHNWERYPIPTHAEALAAANLHAATHQEERSMHPCDGCGDLTAELVCHNCWGTTDDPRFCRECNGVCHCYGSSCERA